MDVLCFIIGNGKTIGNSSLCMAMIMKMLRNGYVERLLLFHMLLVVLWWWFMSLSVMTVMFKTHHHIHIKGKSLKCSIAIGTYCVGAYGKEQQGDGEGVEGTYSVGTYSVGTYSKAKVGKAAYDRTKQRAEGLGGVAGSESVETVRIKEQLVAGYETEGTGAIGRKQEGVERRKGNGGVYKAEREGIKFDYL